MPVGQLVSYELNYNTGECEEFKIENPEHRLYYEFVEFIRIINEKDFVKAKNMLEISIIVSEIMEKARKQQGVIFENDK